MPLAEAGAAPEFQPLDWIDPIMTTTLATPETISVADAQRFDEAALADYLTTTIGVELTCIREMSAGQSNPTFLIAAGDAEFVLRKRPPDKLVPSAHAIDREYRALGALCDTAVPVPRPIAWCDDASLIGPPFYLMERLRGRIFTDPLLPDVPKGERRAIYFSMAETLGALHRIPWEQSAMRDFDAPSNFYKRQLARWTGQWAKYPDQSIPAIDRLADWLPARLPDETPTAIVHGDFRLPNIMFHPVEPRVVGVLDWELSTLGASVADLAHNCINYFMPPENPSALTGHNLVGVGIPLEDEYLEHYSATVGRRETLGAFHKAFALFRLAVISAGIAARAKAGIASNARAVEVGARSRHIAEQGWRIARLG